MNNFTRIITLTGIFIVNLIHNSLASIVSTDDFNKDFFVIWSPNHVNTSADGHERSLKLDQESGGFKIQIYINKIA